jgi:cobalt-precorrin 5A hydrolase
MKTTAIYALTPQGARLGKVLAERFDGDFFLPRGLAEEHGAQAFDRLLVLVAETFPLYRQHVFIAASGIVVRAIAAHLRSKRVDPAVVVIDQRGKHVISLLSGHLGGANRLAEEAAAITGGVPVITTATDTEGVVSIDLLTEERGLVLSNPQAVKGVNMALLKGEAVQVYDPGDWLGLAEHPQRRLFRLLNEEKECDPEKPGVWVTWETGKQDGGRLVLHPPVLIAGVGCNRGTEAREILGLITRTFSHHSLAVLSIRCLVTIEEKREEEGLLKASRVLDVDLVSFPASELRTVAVPNPSQEVMKHMGVESICEAAALLKSGAKELLVQKTKSRNVTLAVALQSFSS